LINRQNFTPGVNLFSYANQLDDILGILIDVGLIVVHADIFAIQCASEVRKLDGKVYFVLLISDLAEVPPIDVKEGEAERLLD